MVPGGERFFCNRYPPFCLCRSRDYVNHDPIRETALLGNGIHRQFRRDEIRMPAFFIGYGRTIIKICADATNDNLSVGPFERVMIGKLRTSA